jgi:hypothetical protein
MNGTPWGVLNDWLRFDSEERAARFGDRTAIADLEHRRRPVRRTATVHPLPTRPAPVDRKQPTAA